MIGHAGHGINSYALSYFLKRDSFSLLLQLSWGGAYMQEPQTTERVNAMFAVLNECAGQLPVTEGRIESSDFYSEERLEPGTLRALLSVTHT